MNLKKAVEAQESVEMKRPFLAPGFLKSLARVFFGGGAWFAAILILSGGAGWTQDPLEKIEGLQPGCQAKILGVKPIFQEYRTVNVVPVNSVVTVKSMKDQWVFFEWEIKGAKTTLYAEKANFERVYTESEMKVLLEKRKIEMDARQREQDRQAATDAEAKKEGKVEGSCYRRYIGNQITGAYAGTNIFNATAGVWVAQKPGYTIFAYRQVIAVVGKQIGGKPMMGPKDELVGSTRSDDSGHFSMSLAPGKYLLVCEADNAVNVVGICRLRKEITIQPGQTTNITFGF